MKQLAKDVLLTFLVTLALCASLFIIHTVFAPKAKADTNSYIRALENHPGVNFSGSKAVFISLGAMVCVDLSNGLSTRQVTNNIWLNYAYDFDRVAASTVVELAQQHLCPNTGKRMMV